jgi:Big-like domain-containing protein
MQLPSRVLVFAQVAQALVVAALLSAAASCDNTPQQPLKGPYLFLSPPSATIVVGDSAVFSATATPPDALRWTTSAPTVAAVSTTGVVRALAPGRATIIVAAVSSRGVAASALVEVRAP